MPKDPVNSLPKGENAESLKRAARAMFDNGIKPPYLVNGVPNYVGQNVIVGLKEGPQSYYVDENGVVVPHSSV